jgi:hypothetical protein
MGHWREGALHANLEHSWTFAITRELISFDPTAVYSWTCPGLLGELMAVAAVTSAGDTEEPCCRICFGGDDVGPLRVACGGRPGEQQQRSLLLVCPFCSHALQTR